MAQATDQQLVPPRGVLEPVEALFRDLRSRPEGSTGRETQRRLVAYGPNELVRRGGAHWPAQLACRFTHPLALLLFVAAGPAFASRTPVLGAPHRPRKSQSRVAVSKIQIGPMSGPSSPAIVRTASCALSSLSAVASTRSIHCTDGLPHAPWVNPCPN
ncbi:MAG: cation-transporting P-type ATPase [Gaiellaceae bacterium]